MRFGMALVVTALSTWLSGSAFASTIYNVDLAGGTSSSAKGTITTDGTTGVLNALNILDWDVLVKSKGNSFELKSGLPNARLVSSVTALTATATGLSFDFAGAVGNFLFFSDASGADSAFCLSDAAGPFCNPTLAEVVANGLGESFQVGSGGVQQIASVAATPIPPTLLLFASALGGLGFLGWRRRGQSPRNRRHGT